MIQKLNGLEMSLTKQYFEDWLVSKKRQDRSFSRTEKKSNHSKHIKSFSITRGSNIFSIRFDIFWLKNFANTKMKFVLEINF